MELLYEILPLIIYALISILLVVLIVLGIKLMDTINKTNAVLTDIEKKSKSLDGLFSTIDNITDTLSLVSDTIVDKISSLIGKVISFRRKKEDDEDE